MNAIISLIMIMVMMVQALALPCFFPDKSLYKLGFIRAKSASESKVDEDFDNNRTYSILASGTQQVTNSKIATIDPTLMLNGSYLLRLQATDDVGRTATITTSVILDKGLKVGNFTLSFTDAAVPVSGIPITVNRTYDSRDKRKGDFGFGWNLDIKNVRLEKSSNLGTNWIESLSGNPPFTEYSLQPAKAKVVTITFPDGKVFKFDAKPKPDHQIAAITQLDNTTTTSGMIFVAEAGTQGTLVSIDAQDLRVEGDIPQVSPSSGIVQIVNNVGSTPGQPYNPYLFKLTTLEGTEFIIDERFGLQSVKDLNGNTLTVTANGIIHSSGKSITFTRDTQGRITQLTDPNGNVTSYTYNTSGDLASVTDAENNTTSFSYITNHYLLDITDPRGIKPIRNDYDSDGRLIKHTDSFGHVILYTHQIGQRMETITDRLGNPTIFEYDNDGNVVKKTDVFGNVTTYTFDANDNQLTETNALGKTTSATYDSVFNKLTDTDALGNTVTYTYNNRRQLLTLTDAKGGVTTNTYDLKGNLLTTKDALNNTTTFSYTPVGGLVATTTNALGGVTSYQHTTTGQLSQATDAQGHISTFTYDQNGNQLTSTVSRTVNGSPQTITTTNTYDKLNRVTKITYADGSFTSTTYNSIGKVATSTNQLGKVINYSYDSQGQLLSTTFADGTSTSSTYDFEGRRITSVDKLGRITSFQYDQVGRLKKTIAPDNSFTTTNYDAIGRVSSTVDQLGHTTSYEYDPNCGCSGRRSKITDALGNITTFTYDQNANQATFTDARSNTTQNIYDALNRQIKVIYADNTFSSTTYDVLGRVTSQTDQDGKTKQTFYDSLGRLIKVRDALNQDTQYTYDELGQQLTQVDAKGNTTQYEYDQLGRRSKRSLPMGQVQNFTYDVAGRLISSKDFNNRVTTYSYDTLNRLVAEIPDPSLNEPTVSYSYNILGLRTSMSDASGTTTYSYDVRNRLIEAATPEGTLTYSYDMASNLTNVHSSNPEGLSVDFAYDLLNRLQQVNDHNLAANASLTQYSYDQVGNLSNVNLPNGVTTTYNYNSLNRLTSMTSAKGIAALSSYTYTLGNAGNRLRVSELSGRVVDYTYDPIYRLTSETISGNSNASLNGAISYTYDQVGNRTSRTSTLAAVASQQNIIVDQNDRLTSDTYDNNGNTVAADGKTFAYDFKNRIIKVTAPGLDISILYNGDGDRVVKTINGVITKYLVDRNNHTGYSQVVEEIQNNVVTRQYTYGLDLISQRQLIGSDRVVSFYQKDGHGSVRYLTDISGNITDSTDYDAFGNLINQVGSTPNLYLFAGEQYDPDLGLYYNRARYLDTNRDRFWSQDSDEGNKEEPLSLHKYLYANDNPISNIDPSGHSIIGIVITTAIILAGAALFASGTIAPVRDQIQNNVYVANSEVDNAQSDVYWQVINLFSAAGSLALSSRTLAVSASRAARAGNARSVALPVLQRLCFVEGTLIQTTKGIRPIEDIKVGDEVLSFNKEKGIIESKQVAETFTHYSDQLFNVVIEGEESEPLGVTASHPFFVVKARHKDLIGDKLSKAEWIQACDLEPEDLVMRPSGDWVKIISIKPLLGKLKVYNFKVVDNHNYFVGQFGVLVHNSNCEIFENTLASRLAKELKDAAKLGAKVFRIGDSGFAEVANSGDTIKWVVTESGELRVMPKFIGETEIPHTILTEGKPVLAAGEAEIAGTDGQYYLIEINNHSGHYLPSEKSLNIGKAAFVREGVIPLGDAREIH